MSVITKFLFDNPSNFTLVKTQVSGGVGSLALQDLTAQTFNQSFDSSTGFTFDAAKTEFVSNLMRQKNQRPASATAGANYLTNLNLNWGDGTLALKSSAGSPVVTSGKLDLTGTNQSVTYTATSKINPRKGSIKLKYTHKFSGNPSVNQDLFEYANTIGATQNKMVLTHDTTSAWRVTANDSAGGSIWVNVGFGTTVLTLDQEIIIEWRWDFTPGSERQELFIDGVQQGGTENKVRTLSDDLTSVTEVRLGGATGAKFLVDDLYFTTSDAQDSAYVVPNKDFITDTIDIPDFLWTTVGTIQSLQSLSVIELDAPRYTIEGKYFDGADWVTSDGSQAQSNLLSIVNTNISTLSVSGQTTISIQVVMPESNVLASVDSLVLTYTGQEFPSEGTLLTISSFVAKDLLGSGFLEEVTTPANTAIKYAIDVNGQNMYFDGAAWVNSDGTFLQANTELEMQTNLDTLLSISSTIKILIILETTDSQVSPDIASLTVQFDFGALDPGVPLKCQVFGYIKDIEGLPISGAIVSFEPDRETKEYREAASFIIAKTISKTTDTNGFFSINLIRSSEFETDVSNPMKYIVTIDLPNEDIDFLEIGRDAIKITVPDLVEVNITDQLTAK